MFFFEQDDEDLKEKVEGHAIEFLWKANCILLMSYC